MMKLPSHIIVRYVLPGLCLFMMFSCSKEPSTDELLVGNWRSQVQKVHSILSFMNNGSFTTNNRIEGKHSKIIEKKGNVKGKWSMPNDGQLVLNVEEGDSSIGWDPGIINYEIMTFSETELVLSDTKTGAVRTWLRIKTSGSGDDEEALLEKEISLGPIVVNLDKSRAYKKERYVCVDIGLNIDISDLVFEEGEEYLVHPEVHEAAIYYLSSRLYSNVKTYDNIKVIHDELFKIFEPYFKGRLKELRIRHIVVTASKNSVEEFVADYEKQDADAEADMEDGENSDG